MNEIRLTEPRDVKIKGFLSPFKLDDQPHLISLPENPSEWVVIFDDEDKLKDFCITANITEYKIKEITNAKEFILSVKEHGLRIMLNPYYVEKTTTTRWTEIELPHENA